MSHILFKLHKYTFKGRLYRWYIILRLDSTIPIVSLTTIAKRLIHPLAADVTDVASTKTKTIAWLVSDCHAHNEVYIQLLARNV